MLNGIQPMFPRQKQISKVRVSTGIKAGFMEEVVQVERYEEQSFY